jgi:hypothetical protein
MQGDHISGSQGGEAAEAAAAVAQSREAAERLWAEIGRLLAATRSVGGRPSGIGGSRPRP